MDTVKPKKQKETKAALDTKVQANDSGCWFILMWRQVNILHLRVGSPTVYPTTSNHGWSRVTLYNKLITSVLCSWSPWRASWKLVLYIRLIRTSESLGASVWSWCHQGVQALVSVSSSCDNDLILASHNHIITVNSFYLSVWRRKCMGVCVCVSVRVIGAHLSAEARGQYQLTSSHNLNHIS